MMRFGPAGYPQGSKNPEDGLNITKSLGLDALEVEFVRGARISEEKARAKEAKAAAESAEAEEESGGKDDDLF